MTPSASVSSDSSVFVILVCISAIFLLSGMDVVMKSLVLAIGVYNTMLWRSVMAAALCGVAWSVTNDKPPSRDAMKLHVWRGVVVCFVATSFFWGLARLPLAEAIALSFIAPFVALYLAAALLGERISRLVVWGSLASMTGVMIILLGKFGDMAYSRDAFLGVAAILISALLYGYNLVLGRSQAQIAPPLEIAFFQNLTVAAVLALAAPWLAHFIPAQHWPALLAAIALLLSGQILMSWAYARAEAQYLIPTEYTAFVWAAILGWIAFGETVGLITIAGAGLIIAGCLFAASGKPKLAKPIEPAGV
ncbi:MULTISPECIES: DMT family transporter [Mesorhizobium]|uniref:DMT family transporter n=1 Tax=Mesorhizobium denitrificans TaxID=2294114 RepID=A0A371XJJ1_9HYPH|nr:MULTISPECIES: DMT family transporter [Mesorhizobium]RFC69390.1 DMT family transporter [Mesorhizobium denitrificans]